MLTEKDLMLIGPYMKHLINIEVREFPNNKKEAVLEYSNGEKWIKDLNSSHPPKKLTGITSIVEHFSRGYYGDSSYRGNCSGLLIKDLYEHFEPKKVLDPCCGSNTSGQVADELGVNQTSLDLNPRFGGFNMVEDDYDQSYDFIFAHFPYFVFEGSKMPVYSGILWGQSNPNDLSRIKNTSEFIKRINISQAKMYQALRKGGRIAMLVGDSRFNGNYFSMFKNMDFYGKVENIIIKRQFNCISTRTGYKNNNFIPIEHEYLIIVKKDDEYRIKCIHVTEFTKNIMKCSKITWRSLIQSVLEHLGGKASRKQIIQELKTHPKAKDNNFLQEKIRQVTNKYEEFLVDTNKNVTLVSL